MFQFPAFAPLRKAKVTGSLPPGCPIRRSAAMAGICPSPRLFAACHVLLRLREPRHPPCALITTCFSSLGNLRLPAASLALPLRFLAYRPPLPPIKGARGRRSHFYWLCLTLGFFSSRSAPLRPPGGLAGGFASSLVIVLVSFWVVRGRVELPTSTLSV